MINKLLIIEDEEALQCSIISYFPGDQFSFAVAASFDEATEKISQHQFACILLDLKLPSGNGLDILRYIKKLHRNDSVIIISAKDSVDNKVECLREGADDYLVKPFHLAELQARIASVLRRKAPRSKNIVSFNELLVDLDTFSVMVNDKPILLSKKELTLLLIFIDNKNRVVSKNMLVKYLAGETNMFTTDYDFLYAHIKNLKRKLAEGGVKDYLKTIYGLGYRWQER